MNEVIMKIIDIIMFSPYGVFALMAALMVEIPDSSTLVLGIYGHPTVSCFVYDGFCILPYIIDDFAKVNRLNFSKR
jgi:Na+/H+-dicarboxylate symporter